ncbi:MAG: efflux RND transporter periplasmic adaptor subunit, partial [Rikenellaceae bacterium]
ITQSTGAISMRATFPNASRVIRSGGAGNVVVPYQKNGCIVIPQAATFEIQDKIYVYKVIDGKAEATQVTAFRINNGTEYIIESGLSVGDVIVAEGVGLVRDGSAIKVASEVTEQKDTTTQKK